jgi:tetratricopeptide (TPR) repeat protein
MRGQWLSALRARLADEAGPYAVLDDSALGEAAELVAATTRPSDIPETCHIVGWLHMRRAMALADERATSEIHTAVPLFMLVHGSGAELPVPEMFADAFANVPDFSTAPPDELWEWVFHSFTPWLQTGADPHFLELAARFARNAVAGARRGDPRRASRLSFLNAAAQRIFEHTGNLVVLEEAIAAGRAAVAEADADNPNLAGHLTHLADSLRTLFERTGDVAVLREAVDFGRRAVRTTAANNDQRYVPMTALGSALRLLYRRTGAMALLDEAAEVSRAAVDAIPDGLAMPAILLANHSAVLHDQIARTGDQAVLNEAIAVTRRAADAAPEGTPLLLSCLYNLANLLQAQFERSGDVRALDESIDVARAVVRATPPQHPDAPLHQGLLVRQLRARFEVAGDTSALDEAISLGHQGVNATPADHSNRAQFLTNLAVALQTRAEHTGDLDELRQAIELKRLAAHTAFGGVHEAHTLSNLTTSLSSYFRRTGDVAALEEAIAIGRAAVAAAPEDHSDRASCEINLASVLDMHGSVAEAIGLLEAAAKRTAARPSTRVEAAQSWGRLAMAAGRVDHALRGYATAVELLPRVATRGLSRADASRWLVRYSELASDAAACALSAGRPERAIELLELGRGVLLAQAIEARSDLTALREADAELADSFEYLCAQLDPVAAEETPDRHREQALELEALIADIRALPGHDRFLLPPDAATLAAQAHDGPIVVVNVSKHRSDAIMVTTAGVLAQELPDLDLKAVTDRQAAMRDALSLRRLSGDAPQQAERAMLDTLAWLWDTIARPVLDRLGLIGDEPMPRLWWIPCGPLAAFPLHAAGHHLDEPGRSRRTALDRAVSSYTPTIRALAHARTRRAPTRSRPPRLLAVVMPQTPHESALPGAREEFEQLSRLFPAVEGLVGPAATHDAVLSRLPSSPWAHFACHAMSDPDDPSNSQLLVHDHLRHPLRVVEISRLNLANTEFAYLSACSTAVTAPDLANESIHVVSACQLAGYPHVVGTLWEISDWFATTIAERVYADLAAGGFDASRAATCLHRAVRLTRDHHPRNPTLWAAYIHAGP